MRIAYVYDAVYPWVTGGGERRVFELSRRLAGRGHHVDWFGIKWWPGEDSLVQEGVRLRGISPPMDLYSGGRRSIREAARFAWAVLSHLEGRYDIIDCQEFPFLPCFPARVRASASDSALVITWLEVWDRYWYEYLGGWGSVGRLVERMAAKLADRNIAISDRTKQDLMKLGARNVATVSPGIDLAFIEGVRPAALPTDLIFAGRLVKDKNVDLLIEAASILRKERPDLRCLIVGEGPERALLEELSRRLGLKGNIEFRGFLDFRDLISLMKASSLFVLPSTREGFGMAALEAFACGLPVVTVDHPMNAALDLIDRNYGLVSPPEASPLARAISLGLDRAGGMRESCRERARSYDWDPISLQLEGIYEGVEGSRRRGRCR
ncbi:MAG: glycosyltransferase family 4 protein [Methanotrichaceae archaeon]|nr:glycosyltransferase family 4 protein [Methanotrichaceae archaeon]